MAASRSERRTDRPAAGAAARTSCARKRASARQRGDDARSGAARRLGVIALALLVAACPRPEEDPDVPVDQREVPRAGEPAAPAVPEPVPRIAPDRDDIKQDTLRVEGMLELVTFHLLRAEDFPIPFSTYIPENMVAEAEADAEGHRLRVVPMFGGQRREEAFLEAFFYPAGTTEAAARGRIRTYAAGMDPRAAEPVSLGWLEWSIAEHVFRQRRADGVLIVGSIALGERRGRYFHVLVQMPAEFGDGMGPRVDRILREWRWEDTGEFLGGMRE